MAKILYIITKSNWGGAQRYVFDLARSMRDNGYEIVVALGVEKDRPAQLKKYLEEEKIKTIPLSGLGRDIKILDIKFLVDLIKLVNIEKPNIVHLNSSKIGGLGGLAVFSINLFNSLKNLLTKIYPKLNLNVYKVKSIFTAHGFAFNEERSAKEKTLIAIVSWLTSLFCHRTITISDKEYAQAKQFPFLKNRIVKIHNGLAPFKNLSAEKALVQILLSIPAEKRPIIEKPIIIGTIAELHSNKGLDFAIKGFAEISKDFPNAIFTIIGEGEKRGQLEKLIIELNMEKRVFLLGHIDEARKILKAFDIFILSSIKEGLPYVILEAGYVGLPILSTNIGGIPDVISDMKSGILIHPKRSKEIAEGIRFILNNKNMRKEFEIRIKERVREEFILEKMFSKTQELYLSVLN